MADEQPENLPTFYTNPIVLNMNDHADLTYAATGDFSFARKVNCVPVALGEIPRLLPHYPVVFTVGEVPMLVALLGIHNEENLFVDEAGHWAENVYIPAYVRRYPFLLVRLANGDVALGADLDPAFLNGTGAKLFEAGKPTQVSQDLFRFCAEYQKALEETQTFCKEVSAAGLLQPKTCTLQMKDGKGVRITGFSAVDEAKLDDLDNRTANGWRKQHFLKYLYFHLASLERIGDFGLRLEKRAVPAA